MHNRVIALLSGTSGAIVGVSAFVGRTAGPWRAVVVAAAVMLVATTAWQTRQYLLSRRLPKSR